MDTVSPVLRNRRNKRGRAELSAPRSDIESDSDTEPRFAAAKAPLINWVIGPDDNHGWAYGNNARRLSKQLGNYRHVINSVERADVAVFFDPLVAERYPAEAAVRIVASRRSSLFIVAASTRVAA